MCLLSQIDKTLPCCAKVHRCIPLRDHIFRAPSSPPVAIAVPVQNHTCMFSTTQKPSSAQTYLLHQKHFMTLFWSISCRCYVYRGTRISCPNSWENSWVQSEKWGDLRNSSGCKWLRPRGPRHASPPFLLYSWCKMLLIKSNIKIINPVSYPFLQLMSSVPY